MLFKSPMCIFCGTKRANDRMQIHFERLGVCCDCAVKLPVTGRTHSFAAQSPLEYLISPFYYKGVFRDAMRKYKFNGCRAYGNIFAELIKEAVSDIDVLREFDIMLSVPLSHSRMAERGYNQSEIIARSVAEFLDIGYSEAGLSRSRNTKRQSGLQSHERIENVRGAFSASEEVRGKSIIIFDDIYTSGSTITECARTLKNFGAERIAAMTAAVVYKGTYEASARLRF